ncbi:hypothetical protein D2M30_1491 [Bacillus amyloliquefaciens]|nr:hypothetical protein D2M30_1491 [Bacillus amyloliquefaciens]
MPAEDFNYNCFNFFLIIIIISTPSAVHYMQKKAGRKSSRAFLFL